MGLDTSHDCWHGPYSAFTRFRCALARVAWGVDLYAAYCDEKLFDALLKAHGDDPLMHLINHSDCDGEIETDVQLALAERLEQLAPLLDTGVNPQVRSMLFSDAARQFAKGLREANASGEAMEFA